MTLPQQTPVQYLRAVHCEISMFGREQHCSLGGVREFCRYDGRWSCLQICLALTNDRRCSQEQTNNLGIGTSGQAPVLCFIQWLSTFLLKAQSSPAQEDDSLRFIAFTRQLKMYFWQKACASLADDKQQRYFQLWSFRTSAHCNTHCT